MIGLEDACGETEVFDGDCVYLIRSLGTRCLVIFMLGLFWSDLHCAAFTEIMC